MTTAAAVPTVFYKGMRVTSISPKYPGNGVVEKVNPKTIQVRLDRQLTVRFDRSFLVPEVPEGEAPPKAYVELIPYAPPPQPGTVVRCSPRAIQRTPQLQGLWIVCGGQGDKSRLFRINNTDGRYWRVPNADLIKVNAVLHEMG